MTQHAIQLIEPGGPEKLKWLEVPVPEPGAGELLIRHKAIGLNFIDIYYCSGFYPLPEYPAIIGMEGVGRVEALGQGTEGFAVGDIVAYGTGPLGAYAEYRAIAAPKVVKLPAAIPAEIAAAIMLKGLTAHFLVKRTFMVNATHTILVQAAAGGVGLLLCQWAKHLGATVIGTVGTPEKAQLARQNGCDHTILYRQENVVEKVSEFTGGRGVHAVYDAVGKDTFEVSLSCLMPFGIFISYGQSSGPLPLIDALDLQRRGSLFFTRPSLMHYKADPKEYAASAGEMFDLILKGVLRVNIGQTYYLYDAAHAHRDLKAGKTTGSTIFILE